MFRICMACAVLSLAAGASQASAGQASPKQPHVAVPWPPTVAIGLGTCLSWLR